jgi:hypothetical protein
MAGCVLTVDNEDVPFSIVASTPMFDGPAFSDDQGQRVVEPMLLTIALDDGRSATYMFGIGRAERVYPQE